MKKRLGVLALCLFVLASTVGACEWLTESWYMFYVGVPVSLQMQAYGTAPFTYTVTSGPLPAGLTLSSSGLLSGTPTTASFDTVFIKMTDANGCHQTQAFAWWVDP